MNSEYCKAIKFENKNKNNLNFTLFHPTIAYNVLLNTINGIELIIKTSQMKTLLAFKSKIVNFSPKFWFFKKL